MFFAHDSFCLPMIVFFAHDNFFSHDSRTEVVLCVTSPAIYLVLSHKKTENFVNKRRKSFGTQPSKRN